VQALEGSQLRLEGFKAWSRVSSRSFRVTISEMKYQSEIPKQRNAVLSRTPDAHQPQPQLYSSFTFVHHHLFFIAFYNPIASQSSSVPRPLELWCKKTTSELKTFPPSEPLVPCSSCRLIFPLLTTGVRRLALATRCGTSIPLLSNL
jgi:hypothetical protein